MFRQTTKLLSLPLQRTLLRSSNIFVQSSWSMNRRLFSTGNDELEEVKNRLLLKVEDHCEELCYNFDIPNPEEEASPMLYEEDGWVKVPLEGSIDATDAITLAKEVGQYRCLIKFGGLDQQEMDEIEPFHDEEEHLDEEGGDEVDEEGEDGEGDGEVEGEGEGEPIYKFELTITNLDNADADAMTVIGQASPEELYPECFNFSPKKEGEALDLDTANLMFFAEFEDGNRELQDGDSDSDDHDTGLPLLTMEFLQQLGVDDTFAEALHEAYTNERALSTLEQLEKFQAFLK